MVWRIVEKLLLRLIASLYWGLSRLWRVQLEQARVIPPPRIFAHWHGDELALIGTHAGRGMAVMSSRSRDGQRLAYVLSLLRFRVVRGSSSRGGASGLKGLVDLVRHHRCDASIAVDGPRGPAHKVKPGIIKLAEITQLPLLPGAAAASGAR
jgi:lysophospholipid acyltransferase (LPLAT)-like uncharacterized protein